MVVFELDRVDKVPWDPRRNAAWYRRVSDPQKGGVEEMMIVEKAPPQKLVVVKPVEGAKLWKKRAMTLRQA